MWAGQRVSFSDGGGGSSFLYTDDLFSLEAHTCQGQEAHLAQEFQSLKLKADPSIRSCFQKLQSCSGILLVDLT